MTLYTANDRPAGLRAWEIRQRNQRWSRFWSTAFLTCVFGLVLWMTPFGARLSAAVRGVPFEAAAAPIGVPAKPTIAQPQRTVRTFDRPSRIIEADTEEAAQVAPRPTQEVTTKTGDPETTAAIKDVAANKARPASPRETGSLAATPSPALKKNRSEDRYSLESYRSINH